MFHLFAAAVCSLVPLAVAWPLAGTSTACEYLLDALNRKRLEDLGHHDRVEALETALREFPPSLPPAERWKGVLLLLL